MFSTYLFRMQVTAQILWLCILFLGSPKLGSALTLSEIPALVLKGNRDLHLARLQLESSTQEKRTSFFRRFPTLELKSTYTRLNDDINIDVGPKLIQIEITAPVPLTLPAFEVDPPPFLVQKKNFWNAHLLLTQPLYTGGRISAGEEAAEAKEVEAQLGVTRSENEKLAEAFSRYLKVKLAQAAIEELVKLEGQLARLNKIATALVTTGMAPKFSTYQVQVAQAQARAKLSQAQTKLSLADTALKATLGQESIESIPLESRLKRPPLPQQIDSFLVAAMKNRTEFNLLISKEKQAEALLSAETGKHLPTVYAFGKYELLRNQLTAIQPYWAVGVGLDIPISAWVTQGPEKEKAHILLRQVELLKHKANEEIPLQIKALFAEAKSKRDELEALDEGARAASEALRLSEVRFKSGQGSSLEALQTEAEWERVQLQRWQTLEEYNQALISLCLSSGNTISYLSLYSEAKEP